MVAFQSKALDNHLARLRKYNLLDKDYHNFVAPVFLVQFIFSLTLIACLLNEPEDLPVFVGSSPRYVNVKLGATQSITSKIGNEIWKGRYLYKAKIVSKNE